MAEQIVSDLIMKFVKSDQAIPAESTTEFQLSGDMSKGFKPGYMFELQSFAMKTGLDPDDEETKAKKKDEATAAAIAAGLRSQTTKGNRGQQRDYNRLIASMRSTQQNASSGFEKWRKGQDMPKGYAVDMDPFEFTRSIDKASALLWKYCIDRVNYDSATLIKRKAAGGASAGEIFLRMDFTKVLMISIDWDHEEPIKETCKFISRAVTIHYLPQLPDGSLGAPLRAFWTMNPDRYKPVDVKKL